MSKIKKSKNTNNNKNNDNKSNENSILEIGHLSENNNYYKFKITLLGDVGVGKTSILNRYINSSFNEDYKSTINVEFKVKTILLEDMKIDLKIWDTVGQEKFHSITKNYYRDSNGVFIIFDLTKKKTFLKLKKYINDVQEYSNDAQILILGNKKDLINEREIKFDDIQNFSNNNNLIEFREISAKSGEGINEAFNFLIKEMINYKNNHFRENSISFNSNNNNIYNKINLSFKSNKIKTNKEDKCC